MKRKTIISLASFGAVALIATAAFATGNGIPGGQDTKNVEMSTVSEPIEVPAGPTLDVATTAGNIKIRLYDDTPLHRDNFLKLAKEGFYDGVLFHRVINDFMVQTGDPDSKEAPAGTMLGSGGPGYTIPAEIVYPKHYHKYGALAAARTGDEMNPERKSSGRAARNRNIICRHPGTRGRERLPGDSCLQPWRIGRFQQRGTQESHRHRQCQC